MSNTCANAMQESDETMEFKERFNELLDGLSVSLTELADASGVSRGSICRYRNGERLPDIEGTNIGKLAHGLAAIAQERGIDGYDEQSIAASLEEAVRAQKDTIDFAGLSHRLRTLLDEMNVEVKDLSASLNYDVSQIYRIRSGSRKPGDPMRFVRNVSSYVLRTCTKPEQRRRLSMLINLDRGERTDDEGMEKPLCSWLAFGETGDETISSHLFDSIEEYDINDYIRLPQDKDLLAKSCAKIVRKRKDYYGAGAIEQATLDFLATIAEGKSLKTMTVYSEFPGDSYDKYSEQSKLFLAHVANLVKRGVHVKTIHNVNRAFDSMVMDFIMWLPLFMSGNISSYYLDEVQADEPRFRHCILAAGDAVLAGEGIASHPESERAMVTRSKDEIEFYKTCNETLLAEAKPLVDVINAQKKEQLAAFLDGDAGTPGERLAFLCSPPLYTLTDDLLERMLERAKVGSAEADEIRAHVTKKKVNMGKILQVGSVSAVLSTYRKQDFLDCPPALYLSEMFPKQPIPYTYGEYLEHLEETRAFAREHDAYRLELYADSGYRNVRVQIHRGKWALVSSNSTAAMHGMITHPRLCWKMENTGAFRNVLGLSTPPLP